MISCESYINQTYKSQYVEVGGVKMLLSDYKKMHRKKQTTKKRKKADKTIKQIPTIIKDMMKQVKVLKSLVAYKENGYKQWGTIANNIMGLREIKQPFNEVVVKAKQAERLIKKIDIIAKDNDTDVFQYVNRLQLRLEELTPQLNMLVNGITSSHVTKVYRDHEAINGEGRRLGLRILCLRSRKAVDELEVICQKLWDIQEKGVDIFEYDHITGKRMK